MKSQFSETQFVVAFLHNLFSYYDQLGLRYLFTMPTQIEEYNVGYDARIQLDCRVQPLYFQFKISAFLSRKNAREYSDFSGPYYRFKIWPADRSPQHNRLVHLSKDGSFVAYCAPLCCTIENFYNCQHDFLESSIMVPCGQLPENHGNERHVITYAYDCDYCYWHSEQKKFSVIYGPRLTKKLSRYREYKNIIDYIDYIKYILPLDEKNIESTESYMEKIKYHKFDNNEFLEVFKKRVYKVLCEISKQILMKYNLILILRYFDENRP